MRERQRERAEHNWRRGGREHGGSHDPLWLVVVLYRSSPTLSIVLVHPWLWGCFLFRSSYLCVHLIYPALSCPIVSFVYPMCLFTTTNKQQCMVWPWMCLLLPSTLHAFHPTFPLLFPSFSHNQLKIPSSRYVNTDIAISLPFFFVSVFLCSVVRCMNCMGWSDWAWVYPFSIHSYRVAFKT